jgi:hypothetical protein
VISGLLGVLVLPTRADAPSAYDRRTRDANGERTVNGAAATSMSELLAGAERRAQVVESEARDLEAVYWSEIDPLVRDYVWLGCDPAHGTHIAVASSPRGAVILGPVMPFHAGTRGC